MTAGPRYRICRWEEHQHYKNRSPPWIKLHRKLLQSHRFVMLSDATKAHYVCLLMLAAQSDGEFVANAEYLARVLHATEDVDLLTLQRVGLIEPVDPASDLLAERLSRGEESRGEKENGSSIEEPANAERWNDRLAPLCRDLGGEEHTANWLRYCGGIVKRTPSRIDEVEGVLWGIRWLRDQGRMEETYGIKKNGVMRPAVLKTPRADILTREALTAYHRHAPSEADATLEQLTINVPTLPGRRKRK